MSGIRVPSYARLESGQLPGQNQGTGPMGAASPQTAIQNASQPRVSTPFLQQAQPRVSNPFTALIDRANQYNQQRGTPSPSPVFPKLPEQPRLPGAGYGPSPFAPPAQQPGSTLPTGSFGTNPAIPRLPGGGYAPAPVPPAQQPPATPGLPGAGYGPAQQPPAQQPPATPGLPGAGYGPAPQPPTTPGLPGAGYGPAPVNPGLPGAGYGPAPQPTPFPPTGGAGFGPEPHPPAPQPPTQQPRMAYFRNRTDTPDSEIDRDPGAGAGTGAGTGTGTGTDGAGTGGRGSTVGTRPDINAQVEAARAETGNTWITAETVSDFNNWRRQTGYANATIKDWINSNGHIVALTDRYKQNPGYEWLDPETVRQYQQEMISTGGNMHITDWIKAKGYGPDNKYNGYVNPNAPQTPPPGDPGAPWVPMNPNTGLPYDRSRDGSGGDSDQPGNVNPRTPHVDPRGPIGPGGPIGPAPGDGPGTEGVGTWTGQWRVDMPEWVTRGGGNPTLMDRGDFDTNVGSLGPNSTEYQQQFEQSLRDRFKQVNDDQIRQLRAAGALTGLQGSGAFGGALGDTVRRSALEQSGILADKNLELSEAERNRTLQSRLAELQARGQKYGVDSGLAGQIYGADSSRMTSEFGTQAGLYGSMFGALAGNDASRYGSYLDYLGRLYSADRGLDSAKLGADASVAAANAGAGASRYGADLNYDINSGRLLQDQERIMQDWLRIMMGIGPDGAVGNVNVPTPPVVVT